MIFNSLQFLVFFPVVTSLFYVLPHQFRWALLLVASSIFYMAFIPWYILILVFTILVDYAAGLLIGSCQGNHRKLLILTGSIFTNVGTLFVFKYYNFLNENLTQLAQVLDWNYTAAGMQLALPIGLSFHTFQAMSYTIEVYRGNQKAERHLGIYALYVMFYPQLVAGPIERPQNLLHQLREPHSFAYSNVAKGLRQMAWGLFKKMVIADRLAEFVDVVFDDPSKFHGTTIALASLAFAIQIYCDFSGYSDIAIGSAETMGFKLMRNFKNPYFSESLSDFWKRWHISLSTWFKDYLYIPLGGNRVSLPRWYSNLIIVFAVSGLWHGANWTFVVWGLINGIYVIIETGLLQHFPALSSGSAATRPLWRPIKVLATFALTCIAWIFFRARNLQDAFTAIGNLFTAATANETMTLLVHWSMVESLFLIGGVGMLFVVEYNLGDRNFGEFLHGKPLLYRWCYYYYLIAAVLLFGKFDEAQFIYFQF